jgi:hypothetical protein
VGGLQPWHWVIAFVVAAVLVLLIVVVVLVIVVAGKSRKPTMQVGNDPGWYPDPRDPTNIRYFDGRQWTEGVRPADNRPA